MSSKDAQKIWAESGKMQELEKRLKELEGIVSNVRPGSWDKNPKLGLKDYEWTEKVWE